MKKTLRLEMLPAEEGDCLWIEYGDRAAPRRVLVDGGPSNCDALGKRIADELARSPTSALHFELLVVTHVDDDHIGGVLELLRHLPAGVTFGDIWFNAYRHLLPRDRLGPPQGEDLSDLLDSTALPWNQAFGAKGAEAVVVPDQGDLVSRTFDDGLGDSLRLTLLSPTRDRLAKLAPVWKDAVEEAGLRGAPARREEPRDRLGRRDTWPPDVTDMADRRPTPDPSQANGSSIALLAEYGSRSLLLGADAFPDVLLRSIGRLPAARRRPQLAIDAFKLCHHGSRYNLTSDLLKALRCSQYLVSTSGRKFCHPDNEALSRIVVHGGANPRLAFNYTSDSNRKWRDAAPPGAPPYRTSYPSAGESGSALELDA